MTVKAKPLACDFEFRVIKETIFVYYTPRNKLIAEGRFRNDSKLTLTNVLTGEKKIVSSIGMTQQRGSWTEHTRTVEDQIPVILAFIDDCMCECGRDLGPICSSCSEEAAVALYESYRKILEMNV